MNLSFIHGGGPQMASYRYRVQIPAKSLGAQINTYPADILIFSKPQPGELALARRAQSDGHKVVVDICDDHLTTDLYFEMAHRADLVTCSTAVLKERIEDYYPACDIVHIAPDAYEFDECEPHCGGDNLLWFGHGVNYHTICDLDIGPIRIVCNKSGCIPWSLETMREEFARADIVLLPRTADYKSPNRAIEAVRQGCFVVAEPHPSLTEFPIWIGDIKEGIAWARQNAEKANEMTRAAQAFVSERFSPAIQAAAWKTALATLN